MKYFLHLIENKLKLNEWNFVALTIDSLKNEIKMFVNDGVGFKGTEDDEGKIVILLNYLIFLKLRFNASLINSAALSKP